MSKLASDIRFWIILFFVIRLVGITNPPLEAGHNWRQSSVNMIARNYQEDKTTFFYPMLDVGAPNSGITGTEFPIYNYAIAIVAKVFGWNHWYGRLINLLISSLGIYFFFLTIRIWQDDRAAFFATLVLLVSFWFAYSRKIMPDTISASFCLMALYLASRWIKSNGLGFLMAFIFLASLGLLIKISSAPILAPLILVFYPKSRPIRKKLLFIVAGFVLLVPVVFWYAYWFYHLVEIGRFQFYFMGPDLKTGLMQLVNDPNSALDNFYQDSLKFSGFVAFLMGIVAIIQHRMKLAAGIFAAAALSFFAFMVKAGYGFSTHEYYTIPFVPVMAFVAGIGIAKLPSLKWRWLLVAFIMIEGIANQYHDFILKDSEKYKLTYEKIADENIPHNAFVAVNSGPNPQELYFLHRKGKAMHSMEIFNGINELRLQGFGFILWNKHHASERLLLAPKFENEHIILYEL